MKPAIDADAGSGIGTADAGAGAGATVPPLALALASERARLLARLNHDLRTPLAQIAARAHGAGLDDLADLAHRQLAWLADLQACARYEVASPELAPAPAWLHALMQACGVRYDAPSLPGLAMLDARLLAQALDRVARQAGGPLALQVAVAADGALVMEFCAGGGSCSADGNGFGNVKDNAMVNGNGNGNGCASDYANARCNANDNDNANANDNDNDNANANNGGDSHRGGISGGAGADADLVWDDVRTTLDSDDIAPGLVLAAHLVRAMGGRLQQAGAALRFAIAAAPADEEQAMPPPPFSAREQPPDPFGDGLTVLLLEPHDAMRDYLTEVFDSAGFSLCYDAAELDGAPPALVVCADADANTDANTDADADANANANAAVGAANANDARPSAYRNAPRVLHALLPPARAEEFDVVLFRPAPASQLLAAARRLVTQLTGPEAGDRR